MRPGVSPSVSPIPRVAIVGGGFAGIAVALRLLRQSPGPLHVALIEPAATPGLGVAYSTALDQHLINGISKAISLFDDAPTHFTDWLERQAQSSDAGKGWRPPAGVAWGDSLPPRRLYGAYLQETWRTETARLRDGITLEHLPTRATGLQATPTGFALTLASGRLLFAEKVVLATGLMPRRAEHLPFDVSPAARASWRYVANQWTPGAWDGIARDQRIVYLGAGLSALDGLISSEHAGFRGEHVALSRHGHGVNARRAPEPWPDFLRIPDAGLTLRELVRQVHPHLRAIAAQGDDWQRIVPTLRLQVDTLWTRASVRERRRFVHRLRPLWDVSLHRSAPAALDWQTRVKAADRYRHEAGHIVGVDTARSGRLAVRWRPRGSNAVQTIEADRVVNCLGFEYDWRRSDDPLCRDVLARGIVSPDPLGFGLQATRDDCTLLNAHGQPQAGLHAVGHPLRGVFWESNAVAEHVPQATKVAQSLLAQLADDATRYGTDQQQAAA